MYGRYDILKLVTCYAHCNRIAKRLVRAALNEAAKKREMRYDDIKRIEKGIRRHFHDDITVVVSDVEEELWQTSKFIIG
ncbi:hypothetical protein Taro_036391 [Colocasia esculenta]|uniref:protein-serine/threonine phosphatase n=1 Tax=Colocasia esculenta TaxID=4460 RepID=A0A843W2Z5_COLES|nr:hypothetical protein [Colocasia esculenta]